MSDVTAVALRDDGRWTGARLQQDRPLLDHDWNLVADASARARRDAAGDIAGPTGVPVGGDGFRVVLRDGKPWVSAGPMWVGGLRAVAAADAPAVDESAAAPGPGRWFVYLEAFEDEVGAAEDPSLVDPALAPVDTCTRVRVRHRVRLLPAAGLRTGGDAMRSLARATTPPPTLLVRVVGPAVPVACDPPTPQPRLLPEGLLRFEVLDVVETGLVLLAWSFDNAAAAVAAAPGGVSAGGTELTLAPSASVKLAAGDLVEVSTPERRGDRAGHGPLFRVARVAGGPGGDVVTLELPLPAERARAERLVVRRWDGQWTGRSGDVEQPALFGGADVGVRFALAGGPPRPGQWWGSRLRSAGAVGVEERVTALPEASPRSRAPLALLELGESDVAGRVVDCRPSFRPLSRLSSGDDLQAAIRALPPDGGELQLAAGTFVLGDTLIVENRQRVVISGAGPATVLSSLASSAIAFRGCEDVTVRSLRAEAGTGASTSGGALQGTFSFWNCRGVEVTGCQVACPDLAAGRAEQMSVWVDGVAPSDVRLDGNQFEVGAGQSAIWGSRLATAVVAANSFAGPRGIYRAGLVVPRGAAVLRVVDNLVIGALQAMAVTAREGTEGGGDVHIAGNVVRLLFPNDRDPSVVSSTVVVRNPGSLRLLANVVTITLAAGAPEHPATVFPVPALVVAGWFGPFVVVRHCAVSGYRNSVAMEPAVEPLVGYPDKRLWLVAQCLAAGSGASGSVVPTAVTRLDDR